MPDDTYTIPNTPNAEVDFLAATEEVYCECAWCGLKPGSPTLCEDCLERREEFQRTGKTRRPLYRRLSSDGDRRLYLSYLARVRDGSAAIVPPESWTDSDLDREFPDRHEERLRGARQRASRNGLEISTRWALASEPRLNVRRVPSTNSLDLTRDLVPIEDNAPQSLGLQPGEPWVPSFLTRQAGRSEPTAQAAARVAESYTRALEVTRPLRQPIDISATVSTHVGLQPTAEEILVETQSILRQFGLETTRDEINTPGVMGFDFGTPGSDLTEVIVWDTNWKGSPKVTNPCSEIQRPNLSRSRFERDLEISEGVYRNYWPVPRDREEVAVLHSSLFQYVGKRETMKNAWEKLFGVIEELPSRFERINWSEE